MTLYLRCQKNGGRIPSGSTFPSISTEFAVRQFEGKAFDQYLIILMVRSLANAILKKVQVAKTDIHETAIIEQ